MSQLASRPIVVLSRILNSTPARSAMSDETTRSINVLATVASPEGPVTSMLNQSLVRAVNVLHVVVGAALDDLAVLHHDDLVGVANRAEAVRDDDAGAAAAPQAVVDVQLGGRV